MIDRLAEDHANARRLAEGILEIRADTTVPENVQTNMVFTKTEPLGFTPIEFVQAMLEAGVKVQAYHRRTVRMVTHRDVSSDDIEYTLSRIRALARN